MTEEAETEFAETDIVYLGRRTTSNHKIGYLFAPLAQIDAFGGPADLLDRNASLYMLKPAQVRAFIVGGVYKFEVKLEGFAIRRARFNALNFVRRFIDSELSAYWSAQDHAAGLQARAAATQTKLKAENSLANEMQVLRQLYAATPVSQRLAVEFAILRALRHS